MKNRFFFFSFFEIFDIVFKRVDMLQKKQRKNEQVTLKTIGLMNIFGIQVSSIDHYVIIAIIDTW